MGSAPYHDAAASPSSEFLHLDRSLPQTGSRSRSFHSCPSGRSAQEQYEHDLYDEDDDASLRAFPRETHLPAASHTALIDP